MICVQRRQWKRKIILYKTAQNDRHTMAHTDDRPVSCCNADQRSRFPFRSFEGCIDRRRILVHALLYYCRDRLVFYSESL